MSKDFPKFSIIIPVKDRSQYLYHTLRTCISQSYENAEFIVADDKSTDDSVDMVKRLMAKDERIKLVERPERVGMLINFEDALNHVEGDYVIALGGDDGLMPEALKELANLIVDTKAELITWEPPIYEYPSEKKRNGMMRLNYRDKSHVVDSQKFLARQTREFGYVTDKECPMFYVKGIASMDLVRRVKARSKDGNFYSCPTPDGYSGIVLAGEVCEFYYSSKPYSIFGASPSSQGKAYVSNDEKAKKDSQEFYKFVSKVTMHKELASQPYSPLISLMTVDYLLTAKDLPGWPGVVPDIDYKALLKHSVAEICNTGYGDDRIGREMDILYNIAGYHGLTEYFTKLLKTAKRRGINDIDLKNIISLKYLYLNADDFDIHNIYEASYAAKYYLSMISQYSMKGLIKSFWRSGKLFLNNKRIIGDCKMFIRK